MTQIFEHHQQFLGFEEVTMGFQFQRRINIGEGWGVNLSKSGMSLSFRSKYGSIN